MTELKRGDIVLIPFPYIQDYKKAKTRPALIIQNDIANRYSPNLIVALISSTIPDKEYPMHYHIKKEVEKEANLERDSIVKCEVIITIPKEVVIKKVGKLSKEGMQAVNTCLKISLALQ